MTGQYGQAVADMRHRLETLSERFEQAMRVLVE